MLCRHRDHLHRPDRQPRRSWPARMIRLRRSPARSLSRAGRSSGASPSSRRAAPLFLGEQRRDLPTESAGDRRAAALFRRAAPARHAGGAGPGSRRAAALFSRRAM